MFLLRRKTFLGTKEKRIRNSHPEVFLRKGVLKICSEFTGKHPCRSVISIKLLSAWVFSSTFAAYFQNTFSLERLCTAGSGGVYGPGRGIWPGWGGGGRESRGVRRGEGGLMSPKYNLRRGNWALHYVFKKI